MTTINNSVPPVSLPPDYRPDLVSPYIKLSIAIIVVVAIVLGVYFFVIKNSPTGNNATNAGSLCICKECGMQIRNTTGMDCEEIQCPNCGHALSTGTMLAAVNPTNPVAQGNAPLTQNQRETLAEQGVVTPGPMGQNQRETLAEQGITAPQTPNNNNLGQVSPQPIAAAQLPVPMNRPGTCICPNCGTTVQHQNGISCSNMFCPNCRSKMTNAIMIGRPGTIVEQREPMLIGMQNNATCPQANTTPTGQGNQNGAGNHMFANAPQQVGLAAPCPMHPTQNQGTHPNHPMHQQTNTSTNNTIPGANTQSITYSNTIQGIIGANCLRCHGGPIRNLSTYQNLKSYADNGLLMMMVQPGGPMSRFLSADDAHKIITWVKAGAPP